MKILNVFIVLGGIALFLFQMFSDRHLYSDSEYSDAIFYDFAPFAILSTLFFLLVANSFAEITKTAEKLQDTGYRKNAIIVLIVIVSAGTVISMSCAESFSGSGFSKSVLCFGPFNGFHLLTNIFLLIYFFIGLPKLRSRYEQELAE